MKQFLLSLVVLLGITLTSQAQSVGILVQPNFSQDYVGTGFFAEANIVKDLGVYADYRFHRKSEAYNMYASSRRQIDQVNIGISYRVSEIAKVIVSTSIVHQVKHTNRVFHAGEQQLYIDSETSKLGNTLGLSGLFGVTNSIQALVGFEANRAFTDNRLTIGIGVGL